MRATKIAIYFQQLMSRLLFLISLFLVQSCGLEATSSTQPTTNQQLNQPTITHSTTHQGSHFYDFTNYDSTTANLVITDLIKNQNVATVRNLPIDLLQEIIDTHINKLIFSPDQFVHVQPSQLIHTLQATDVAWIYVEDPEKPSIVHAIAVKPTIRGSITLYANTNN